MRRSEVAFGIALCAFLASCTTTAPTAAADVSTFDAGFTPVSTHRIYAFDTISFIRLDPDGRAVGWDLDHKISDDTDKTTCNHSDFLSPDGVPGIDNQFATLVPLLAATRISAVEQLLQASITSGGILMLVELNGIDDLKNDPDIDVRVRAAFGVPLLGTDGLLLTDQTFHVSPRDPDVHVPHAWLKDGVLETPPFDIVLPVQVFGKDYALDARGAHVRFHIVDGERIDHGSLGAGITLQSIRAIALKAAEGEGDILEIVENLVAGNGDLEPDASGACTQMSAGLQFTGVSAYFFAADTTPTTGGADASTGD